MTVYSVDGLSEYLFRPGDWTLGIIAIVTVCLIAWLLSDWADDPYPPEASQLDKWDGVLNDEQPTSGRVTFNVEPRSFHKWPES